MQEDIRALQNIITGASTVRKLIKPAFGTKSNYVNTLCPP